MGRSIYGLFAICVLVWSTTWLAITFQLGEVPPAASVTWRFALAATIAALICRLRGASLRFPLRLHGLFALLGLTMFCLSYLAVYYAETILVSGLVAVGYSVSPLVNMLFSRLALGAPMRGRHGLGGLLGLTGVGLVFWPELAGFVANTQAGLGIALVGGAVLASSAGNVVATLLERRAVGVWPRMAWGMAYGALGCLAAMLLSGEALTFAWTVPYVASLLYLAVFGSVVAFSAYLAFLDRTDATQAGYIGVMVPIVALGVSALFEDFVWGPWTIAGVLVAMAGNLMLLRSHGKHQHR